MAGMQARPTIKEFQNLIDRAPHRPTPRSMRQRHRSRQYEVFRVGRRLGHGSDDLGLVGGQAFVSVGGYRDLAVAVAIAYYGASVNVGKMVLLAESLKVFDGQGRDHPGQFAAAGAQNLELAEVAHPPAPGVVLGSAPSNSYPGGYRDRGQIRDALGAHRFGRLRFTLDPASGMEQSDCRHEHDDDGARVCFHPRFNWSSRRRTVAGLGPPITRRRRSEIS